MVDVMENTLGLWVSEWAWGTLRGHNSPKTCRIFEFCDGINFHSPLLGYFRKYCNIWFCHPVLQCIKFFLISRYIFCISVSCKILHYCFKAMSPGPTHPYKISHCSETFTWTVMTWTIWKAARHLNADRCNLFYSVCCYHWDKSLCRTCEGLSARQCCT